MSEEIWNQAIGCLLVHRGQVLLVRHTYGSAKDKLLIPGGYCQKNESPRQAASRELQEETGIEARAAELFAVRFGPDSWYTAFLMEYISGTPVSDNNENSEALFMDLDTAITHPDITNLTFLLLDKVKRHPHGGLVTVPEYRKGQGEEYLLYGAREI